MGGKNRWRDWVPFSNPVLFITCELRGLLLFTYLFLYFTECSSESLPPFLVIRMKRYLTSRVTIQNNCGTHSWSLSCEQHIQFSLIFFCPNFLVEYVELWCFLLGHTHCLLASSYSLTYLFFPLMLKLKTLHLFPSFERCVFLFFPFFRVLFIPVLLRNNWHITLY